MTITANDPLFAGVLTKLGASFIGDVVNLINRSPTLAGEIATLDATLSTSGTHTEIALISDPTEGGDSTYHSPFINISSLISYDDTKLYYLSGSFTADYDEITPAAAFVGTIAHEIGHWFDPGLQLMAARQFNRYSVDQSVAVRFASEGKAAYNQYKAKYEIEQGPLSTQPVPATMANALGAFHSTNSPEADSEELQTLPQFTGVGAAESYLADGFFGVDVKNGTYFSNYWASSLRLGSINYLGIDYTTVNNLTVTLDNAGNVTGSTLLTDTNSYQFTYSGVGSEVAYVSDLNSNLLYSEVFTDTNPLDYVLARYQTNGFIVETPLATETIVGSANNITDGSGSLTVEGGNANSVTSLALTGHDTLDGDNDQLFSNEDQAGYLTLTLSGANDQIVLGGNTTVMTGGTGLKLFGGAGPIDDTASQGIFILGSGAASISGATGSIEVFGGSGVLNYSGGVSYADVIGGAGTVNIAAAAGGGWYSGGSSGMNILRGSDSGEGTVLQSGGDGDLLIGGSNGGDYFIAGPGSVTMQGNNIVGTQQFFLGSGSDTVQCGTGNSIVDTGSGYATVVGAGSVSVFAGTGHADSFTTLGGTMTVYGFRSGIDHVTGSIGSVSRQDGNTTISIGSGLIVLHNVVGGFV